MEVDETGTDPNNEDTDGDGLLDGTEVTDTGTDPLDEDTDDDGFIDGEEFDIGTDPASDDLYPEGTHSGGLGCSAIGTGGSKLPWALFFLPAVAGFMRRRR